MLPILSTSNVISYIERLELLHQVFISANERCLLFSSQRGFLFLVESLYNCSSLLFILFKFYSFDIGNNFSNYKTIAFPLDLISQHEYYGIKCCVRERLLRSSIGAKQTNHLVQGIP